MMGFYFRNITNDIAVSIDGQYNPYNPFNCIIYQYKLPCQESAFFIAVS